MGSASLESTSSQVASASAFVFSSQVVSAVCLQAASASASAFCLQAASVSASAFCLQAPSAFVCSQATSASAFFSDRPVCDGLPQWTSSFSQFDRPSRQSCGQFFLLRLISSSLPCLGNWGSFWGSRDLGISGSGDLGFWGSFCQIIPGSFFFTDEGTSGVRQGSATLEQKFAKKKTLQYFEFKCPGLPFSY